MLFIVVREKWRIVLDILGRLLRRNCDMRRGRLSLAEMGEQQNLLHSVTERQRMEVVDAQTQ